MRMSAQISDSAFYAQMALIRRTEQAFFDLYARGLMAGTVHTSIGQEACAVGVVSALDRGRDVIFSSHRAHGHYLAYCDDVEGLVAELLGRSSGVVGGVGGTQHLHKHNLYTNGIQGGIVPNAVGAALAEKLGGSGAIVTVFVGDGTMGQGVVYESMNLAALWQLPVLFVLEDNGYAQSTPRQLEHAGVLADRPRAFGITTYDLSGGSEDTVAAQPGAEDRTAAGVREIYTAACQAVQFVREQCRPCFLALPTYRLAPHSKGDDTRSAEEIASAWARDPLERLGKRLEPQVRAHLDAAAERRVGAAIEAALAQRPQTPAEFGERAQWQPA
jgi:TPP-dependent pyruvate/acetoin dehydrogenase alpha subunit